MKTTLTALQEQKDYILHQLFELIHEHETSNFCTNYDKATETMKHDLDLATNQFYDVGRYEALKEVLRIVQKI